MANQHENTIQPSDKESEIDKNPYKNGAPRPANIP
jgi:hypothetical protein